jgi:flagellar hook-associated protein 2
MGTTSTQYFTGLSTYSSDFQSIIQRAVSIAQIPIQALQTKQTHVMNQKAALVALNPEVASLGSAVAALGTLAANQGVSAYSSDSSTVSVTNTGATSPGTYTVSNIQSLASAASETSVKGYANTTTTPVSASGNVNLVVGQNTYQLNLTNNNNLAGLESAINNAGAGVNASILTIGSENYLSVAASNTGATTLQLSDAPVDLITNTGSGTETSTGTYADTTTAPVSSSGKLNLVVGSNTYNLNVTTNNNLTGLMNAVNGSGAGVTATITGSAGAYSLSITGSGAMALNDLQPDLITSSNQGTNAQFTFDGHSTSESTNTISDIIPGVSFTLLKQTSPTTSVTLSLATDPGQLSNALQTLVSNYNTLEGQLQQQVGPSAGPLGGDLLINQINSDIQQLTGYWNNSGSIHSLADLGVTFNDNSGTLSFDPSVISGFSSSQLSDAFKFLGSANSGFSALASNFTQLSDPISGLILDQENGYDTENTELTNQINTLTDQANQQQASLTAKVQAADALVAQLQSQQNTVGASITSLNYVLYGYQNNTNGSNL